MRHRVKTRQFNRNTNQRKALLRELVRSLVSVGTISTTKAKAKEVQRITDKLIVKAQKNSVPARRKLHQFFGKRDIVNTLVDRVAPAMGDRNSGFTRIVELGKRRGDNATLVELQFVTAITEKGLKKPAEAKKKQAAKKSAPTKKASKPAAKKSAQKTATKKTTSKKPAAQKSSKKK